MLEEILQKRHDFFSKITKKYSLADKLFENLFSQITELSPDEFNLILYELKNELIILREEPLSYVIEGLANTAKNNYSLALFNFQLYRNELEHQQREPLTEEAFERLDSIVKQLADDSCGLFSKNDGSFESQVQQKFFEAIRLYVVTPFTFHFERSEHLETEILRYQTNESLIKSNFERDVTAIISSNFTDGIKNRTVQDVLTKYQLSSLSAMMAKAEITRQEKAQQNNDETTLSQLSGTKNSVFQNEQFNYKRIHPSKRTYFEELYMHFSQLPFVIDAISFEQMKSSTGQIHLYLVTPYFGNTLENILPHLSRRQKKEIFATSIEQLAHVHLFGTKIITTEANEEYYVSHIQSLFEKYGFVGSESVDDVSDFIEKYIAPRLAKSFEPLYYKDDNLRNIIVTPNLKVTQTRSEELMNDIYMIDFEHTLGVHPAVDLVNLLEFGSSYFNETEIKGFIHQYLNSLSLKTHHEFNRKSFYVDYYFARVFRHLALGMYRTRDLEVFNSVDSDTDVGTRRKMVSSVTYHLNKAITALNGLEFELNTSGLPTSAYHLNLLLTKHLRGVEDSYL